MVYLSHFKKDKVFRIILVPIIFFVKKIPRLILSSKVRSTYIYIKEQNIPMILRV